MCTVPVMRSYVKSTLAKLSTNQRHDFGNLSLPFISEAFFVHHKINQDAYDHAKGHKAIFLAQKGQSARKTTQPLTRFGRLLSTQRSVMRKEKLYLKKQ